MAKKRKKNNHHFGSVLLFSYCPLLIAEPGQTVELSKDPDKGTKQLEAVVGDFYSRGHCDACLWTKDGEDGPVGPILAVPQAKEIAEHFKMWCENDTSWFTLHIHATDIAYAMALMPDVERSINRHRTAMLLIHEKIITSDNYRIIFSPLRFGSYQLANFHLAKPALLEMKTISVGLIDTKDVHQDDLSKTRKENIHMLGEFTLNMGDVHGYLASYLNDMAEDLKDKPG